jgi:DNA polymerase III delta subunit
MADNIKLCWITGGHFLCQEIFDRVKNQLPDSNIQTYREPDSAEYIEMKLFESDMFDEKDILFVLKTVPVFDCSTAKSNKRWIHMFESIPEGTIMVIRGCKPRSSKNALWIYAKKYGKVFEEPCHVTHSAACEFVKSRLSIHQKSMSDEDVSFFVNAIGEEYKKGINVDKLYLNFKKIHQYVGSAKKISRSDIIRVVYNNSEFVVWQMFTAFDKKDYPFCCRLYRQACSNVKDKLEVIHQVMRMSLWRYRMLLFLKESVRLGKDKTQIQNDISGLYKLARDGSGFKSTFSYDKDKNDNIKPAFSSGVVQNALLGNYADSSPLNYYHPQDLYDIVKCINECLHKMRTNCTKTDIDLLVDNLFMTICKTVPDRLLVQGRGIYNE